MTLYKITNKQNGHCYVGQTIRTLKERWREHLKPSASHCALLIRAFNKYGKQNFSLDIIAEYASIEDLNNAEEYYINFFNCLAPNGYNLIPGGNNKLHNAESKRKMSLDKLGKKNPNFGKKISENVKEKIRQTMLGRKNHFYGKKHTSKTKLKMSISRKLYLKSKEIK